ncbi:hypothetical protein [Floridanema aerugineum]|uniref:Uncharacterized protein n=1 Tax=Floridaenema aerugineum BLCC-F46 TaxID=3153654 RepID=A0ABV4XDW1_9CYAN
MGVAVIVSKWGAIPFWDNFWSLDYRTEGAMSKLQWLYGLWKLKILLDMEIAVGNKTVVVVGELKCLGLRSLRCFLQTKLRPILRSHNETERTTNLLIWVECLRSSGESRHRSHIIGDDYLHLERSHLVDCLTNYAEYNEKKSSWEHKTRK